jgi:hypothetical protein
VGTVGDLSVESRLHDRTTISSTVGRTVVAILCPFCGVTTEAYLWSLAGSGKRCECGAVHHHHPAVTIKQVSR